MIQYGSSIKFPNSSAQGGSGSDLKLWNPLATQGQPKYQNIQAGVKKSGVFAIVDSATQFAIDQIPVGTVNSIITFDSEPNIGWRIISTTSLQSRYTTPSIVADEATLNSTFPPSEEYNDYYCFVNSTNTYWQCKIFGTDFAWDNTGRQTIDTLSSNEIYDLLQSNSIFDRNRANHEGTQPASTISDFTESAQNAIGNALLDTTTIDLTYNDAANQISANVKDLSLTDSKIATDADISASKIKQTTISPELNPFTNGDTQDVINNKAQGQLNNLENLINTRPIGASNGVVYYLTSQNSPVLDYELLSFSPDNSPLDIESKTINSTTPKASRLIHSYISSYTINRSTINGGNWIFNLYGYASQLNGVSNFQIDVYKRTGTTETLLFSCETSTLLQTTQASPELNVSNVEITQQDFVVNENDYLVIKIFAKTERTQDTIITLLHSGTLYASHIHTPLIISHNQLAGAQGGTATEKYHLQLTDYNKVLNLDNSLATKFSKNIGNEISLLTEKTTVNGNDFGLLEDSEDSNKKKKYKVSAISNYTVAALTPTLDGKVDTTTNQNIGGNKTFSQNITLNAVPSQGTHVIRKNELDNLETSVNNNLNLKTTITNLRQESTRFIEKTYGLDTNNGLTPDKPFKTIETGWNDVNPSGQVKILGSAEYTVNHTFLSTKQSIKTILDSGAKIIGTINLVSGNTSMQFFDGKISATINDASNGTCYFNNVDLSGTTLNFTNGGYKYIANATSSPTLINLPDLSGVTGTLQLSNINGVVPISIGSGWTVIKAITTLSIISKNASSPLFDSNSYYINSVLTTQAQLDAIVTDGSYIVNFANPTGITGLSQGDIIYKVGLIKVIINKFNDAPPSVSVFSAGGAQTWIKQAVSTWVNAVINSANRLPANYIADGSVSNTQFQYLNTTTSNVQTQLNNKLATSLKGAVNGLAELDEFGKVPSAQLPAFVDDVLEFDNLASFPATGETGKIYVAKDTNLTYRWSGTQYVEISASLALGETSSTAYRGDRGKIAYDHSQATGNPHGTTKGDVGLGNVDNTADINKNVLSATKLTTARNINGVGFDGTADITVADTTKQPLDARLTALAGLNSILGFISQTGTDTFTKRIITGSNGIRLTNGNGVGANPIITPDYGRAINTITQGNDARLGTKDIDETNIANNRIQVYNTTTGKLEYQDLPIGSTNLAIANKTATTLDITSDTGADVTIPSATITEAGLMTSADKVKLNGIATGATANSTDAELRDRATHTGSQAISTITGLQTALNDKQNAIGSNLLRPTSTNPQIIINTDNIEQAINKLAGNAQFFSVQSQAEMLALTDARVGDYAVRKELTPIQIYTLNTTPASVLENWGLVGGSGDGSTNQLLAGNNITIDTQQVGNIFQYTINASGLVSYSELANYNYISNGNFSSRQQGNTITHTGTGNQLSCADRFFVGRAGGLQNDIISTRQFVNNTSILKIQRVSGTSSVSKIAVAQGYDSETVQEGFAGRTKVFSFSAFHGVNYSGTNGVTCRVYGSITANDLTGRAATGFNTNALNASFTVPSIQFGIANIQRYNFLVAIPSNIQSLMISFEYVPVGTAGADDSFFIANLKSEIGTVATPFIYVPSHIVLDDVLPYYERIKGGISGASIRTGNAFSDGTITARATLFYRKTKRRTPTLVVSDNAAINILRSGTDQISTGITFSNTDLDTSRIDVTASLNSLNTGESLLMTFVNTTKFIDVLADNLVLNV